jgi:hypothetical protein
MLLVLGAALALTIGVATANTAQVQRSPSMQTAERHGEPKNELPFTRLVAERATAQAHVGGQA